MIIFWRLQASTRSLSVLSEEFLLKMLKYVLKDKSSYNQRQPGDSDMEGNDKLLSGFIQFLLFLKLCVT